MTTRSWSEPPFATPAKVAEEPAPQGKRLLVLDKAGGRIAEVYQPEMGDWLIKTAERLASCLAEPEGTTRAALIKVGRDLYQNDDVEIDDDALLSESDQGFWVQAWVHVNTDDLKDDDCPQCDEEEQTKISIDFDKHECSKKPQEVGTTNP